MATEHQEIRVVLVETHYPGNIGAAARAMKTMGLTDLWLVNPMEFPSPRAEMMATEAADVLKGAVVVNSLREALEDCVLTIATSARSRSADWPSLSVEQAAAKLKSAAVGGPVALVFGPEPSGLSSSDLYLTQFQSSISTGPNCNSLNLAQAVQIYAYELFKSDEADILNQETLATHQQREALYQQTQSVLESLEFPKRDPDHLMLRFRRIFNRSQLSEKEVNLIQGLWANILSRFK